MSEVYLATQVSLNRTVAVKLIRQETDPGDDLMLRDGTRVAVSRRRRAAIEGLLRATV